MHHKITYEEYLTICLLKLNYNLVDLTYEKEFRLATFIYEKFQKSNFNNPNKPLYECLEDCFKNTAYDDLIRF